MSSLRFRDHSRKMRFSVILKSEMGWMMESRSEKSRFDPRFPILKISKIKYC